MGLTLNVRIPALDRLLDYLEARDQSGVDAATALVVALTSRLKDTKNALQTSLNKGNQNAS